MRVRWFAAESALADAAAEFVGDCAEASARARGRFLLVLSGGRTPAGLYRRLAERSSFPWPRTHVFWGDERLVPPGDPRSNATLAEVLLLSKVDLRPQQVHRVPVASGSAERAAGQWEAELRAFFGAETPYPVFDLVLLGVGTDGHTASLFPGDPALEERQRWVVAVGAPAADPPVPRVTLTLPVLSGGREVLFLAGREKAAVVRAIEEDPAAAAARFPAARVRPAGGAAWYVSDDSG
ncbi:MAG: 6-phosphogluconolactonase [Deltaproteobacteria bacterium]|nr:6-phosphogluconolactonase [Deltaproteobacteria bacterium]